jgi:hypothetical protein
MYAVHVHARAHARTCTFTRTSTHLSTQRRNSRAGARVRTRFVCVRFRVRVCVRTSSYCFPAHMCRRVCAPRVHAHSARVRACVRVRASRHLEVVVLGEEHHLLRPDLVHRHLSHAREPVLQQPPQHARTHTHMHTRRHTHAHTHARAHARTSTHTTPAVRQ